MTQKDIPFKQPQEVEPRAPLSPLSKPRRRSKPLIVFALPIIGCLVFLAGGGILLWQFIHPSQAVHVSQSSQTTPVQNTGSSGGQSTKPGCVARLPWDWIAQQLPPGLHLTETQVKRQVRAGKSVQTIAAEQGVSAQQLYRLELQIMHTGNVRWHQEGCLSQSDYNDNEQRANAMTPAQMNAFFTSLYQG